MSRLIDPQSRTGTVENLAALGSDRLVGILMALAKDDADIPRRLRLELAGQAGSPPAGPSR
jgi:hypothetical protein